MAADATTNATDEVVETLAVTATAEVAVEPVPVSPPAVSSDASDLLAKFETLTKKVETMEKLQSTRY